jgi:Na+:H+ antiporter, NhaA family
MLQASEHILSSTQQSSDSTSRLRNFIDHEATGGLLLALAALVAIALVNIGFNSIYHALLEQRVSIGIGALTLEKSLHHFINDGLMAIFFFLVGLEIKREVLEGNLATPSQIILPAAAAIGGILVPSGIYAWFNWGNAVAIGGWAIPAATDIAFALGALAIAGKRVPLSLKVFLLTLATFDDLAAIIIIAVFYSSNLSLFALAGAAVSLAVLLVMNRLNIGRTGAYVVAGIILWAFVLESGVHATLAGVALGLMIPLKRHDGTSPLHELEHALHPYVKWIVLPLFAFANAGLTLNGLSFLNLSQPVPLGIIAGLVIGKPVGILVTVATLVFLGLAKLPEGSNWRDVTGVACLAGIGFTMSLFIGSLAFADATLEAQVRVGVVVASSLATALGLLVLLPRRGLTATGT